MDSDTHHLHHHHNNINNNNQQQQQQQGQGHENMNTGLTRYRSAPSSYFSNLINSGVYGDEDLDPFFNSRISTPDISRFMSTGDDNRNFDEFMKQEQVNYSQPMMYNNNNNNVVSSSNLVRQSSSPAGFLEHSNMDNGYPMMRSMNFSSGSRLLSRIPEHEGRNMLSGSSWDESSFLADGFLNELEDNQEKMNDGGRIQSSHVSTGLTHQLSLPTSSTELSVKEKLLHFQDNVPLRSRAKRGCATHPRSIAERVRRTRISERMRKLQDLVPNMDKQTSTADMLDLAVDYIKELQNQVETLSERQTKCTCSNKLKS
ncbi:hypothetical protein M8C21_017693 [Ambrosia artemisiifolia]|uniref:BHLH domain-containing protein n=1 Tax=Ambrosia artemisiifolia TaxID=4212 RepID=A0AAD5CQF8_AMBAR|nr:hypothetical protein M8C21_017693 [Ambrosia artemisiifolia]